jgi:hypothetical protein
MNKTINYYSCESCDLEWQDIWECECSDDCPQCGIETAPHESEATCIAEESKS